MTTRRFLLLAALFVTAALAGWALLARSGGHMSPRSEHPVTVPETVRTVTVSLTMPAPSSHERRLSAMLERGAMPMKPMLAEVTSDAECAPDAEMLSRCRNEMRLADGRTIVVRHPHDMRSIPCLAPGEKVLVVPASA